MNKFKLYKFGDTKIQFNEIDTNEVKIVDFVCEYLRDEAFSQLNIKAIRTTEWNPLTDPWD